MSYRFYVRRSVYDLCPYRQLLLNGSSNKRSYLSTLTKPGNKNPLLGCYCPHHEREARFMRRLGSKWPQRAVKRFYSPLQVSDSENGRTYDGVEDTHETVKQSGLPRDDPTLASNQRNLRLNGNSDKVDDGVSKKSEQRRVSAVAKASSGMHNRPTAWQAPLDSKVLGSSASVLVVRDAEGRPRPNHQIINEAGLSKDIKSSELVKSIESSKSAPDQEQVHLALDTVKSRFLRRQKTELQTISRRTYDDLVKDLCNQFNQQQLSQYLETRQNERTKVARLGAKNSTQRSNQDTKELLKGFTPIDEQGIPISRPSLRGSLSGKKALSDSIIRDVWGMEIDDEIHLPGLLTVRLDGRVIAMLTLDKSYQSILTTLSNELNVKIVLHKPSLTAKVTGPKSACLRAAIALRSHAKTYIEVKLPLELLTMPGTQTFKGTLDKDDAFHIAKKYGCYIDGKFLKGFGSRAIETTTRAVVAAARGRPGDSIYAVNIDSTHLEGLPSPAEPVVDEIDEEASTNVPGRQRSKTFGRFMVPLRLARGDTPARLTVDGNLLREDVLASSLDVLEGEVNQDSLGRLDQHDGHSIISATFGQLKWHEGTIDQKSLSHQLFQVVPDKKPPIFRREALGFPQLLNRISNMRNNHPNSVLSELRITLILHPLSQQQVSSEQHHIPLLHLIFEPHSAERSLTFKHALIEFPSPNVSESNIMVPTLATDVLLTHSRYLRYELDMRKLGKPLDDFVRKIEAQGAGYANFIAPPEGVMYLPFWPKQHHGGKLRAGDEYSQWFVGMKLKEKKIFTKSIELVQELRWDLSDPTGRNADLLRNRDSSKKIDGAQLVYTRSSGTEENGILDQERLEVQYRQDFAAKGLSKEKREKFRSCINEVLEALNKGVGLMHLRPVDAPRYDVTDGTADDTESFAQTEPR